uniref:Large ribosomal subunit protein mL44 n=2 Tax=Tetranychus urticae TaxID=32264 RepID=T1KY58_TETUR
MCVNNVEKRGIKTWLSNTLREMKDRNRDFDLVPHKKRHKREWVNWNYDSEIYAFGKRLNEDLSQDELKKIFIDQSYVDEEEKRKKDLGLENVGVTLLSNSELSNKGDSIMKSFTQSYLRFFLPRVPEECISSISHNLCSNQTLSHIGGYIGCKDLIMSPLIDPTEEMIANSVKSLIAVLDETKGSKQCEKFIIDIILPYLHDKDLLAIWDPVDPENKVRKILQNDGLPDFEPRLMRETGRNTIFSCYIVGLYVNKNLIGYGPGETIQVAQEMAAYDALRRFFNLTVSGVRFKFGPAAHNLDYKSKQEANFSIRDWKLSYFTQNTNPVESPRKVAVSM